MIAPDSMVRITQVLDALGLPHSSWYRPLVPACERKRPGPATQAIPEHLVRAVIYMAELYPWYGYKKIAVICRRAGYKVKNRHAYRVMDEHGLLHRRRCSAAELYQAAKLYELYPYPLSRQKTGVFKVDSSPYVKAVGTEEARRATGVPTATPYTSAGVR